MLKNRKKEFTWTNPYIALAQQIPERLVLAREQDLTEQQVNIINAAINKYEELIIELGSGSGMHIIEQAKRRPNALFVGFELRFKRAYRTIVKAQRSGVENLIVIVSDARKALQILSANSVSGSYINFPDPWDKRRWSKHRLFDQDLIAQFKRILKPGGFVIYKTDHEPYFSEVEQALINSDNMEIIECTRDLYACPASLNDNVPTEFEGLFRSQSLPICRLYVKKM